VSNLSRKFYTLATFRAELYRQIGNPGTSWDVDDVAREAVLQAQIHAWRREFLEAMFLQKEEDTGTTGTAGMKTPVASQPFGMKTPARKADLQLHTLRHLLGPLRDAAGLMLAGQDPRTLQYEWI